MLIGYVSDERYVAIADVAIEIDRDGETIAATHSTARGKVIADTTSALALKEATYPVVNYIPRADIDMAMAGLELSFVDSVSSLATGTSFTELTVMFTVAVSELSVPSLAV